MIIKSADDKSKRLKLLEGLQQSPRLDAAQKDWLSKQLRNLRKGIAGERDAAHYIDSHYRDRSTHAVIHDLRIQVGDEIAQIDHLVISRGMHFYLLETKSFNGDIFINDHGEFSVRYGGDAIYGIPSPLEQSRRHVNVLSKLLERLEIRRRTRRAHHYHNLVLVHPKSNIKRPSDRSFDTSHVIKADAFATWHERFQNKLTVIQAITAIFDIQSAQGLKAIAEKIVRQHRPSDPLELPAFISTAAGENIQKETKVSPLSIDAPSLPSDEPKGEHKKRLICSSCGVKITFPEGQFCWKNERRFGGRQYCRQHQRDFS